MSITFVVPCHQAEKTLPELAQSFLSSSSKEDRLLLIIDGEEEEATFEVASSLAKDEPRIEVVYPRKRMGASGARKLGISKAKTDYIGFADADDSFPSGAISEIHRYLELHDVDVLNYSFYVKQVKGGHKNAFVTKEGPLDRLASFHGIMKDSYIRGFLWTKVFRRSYLQGLDFYEMQGKDAFYEDLILSTVSLVEASSAYYTPKALYNYHQMGLPTAARKPRTNRTAYHLAFFASVRLYLTKKGYEDLLPVFFKSKFRSYLSYLYDISQDKKFGLPKDQRKALKKAFSAIFNPKEGWIPDPLYQEYIDPRLR